MSIPPKHPEDNFALNLYFDHIINDTKEKKSYELPESLESAGTLRYFGLSGVLSEIIEKPGKECA